MGCSLPGSSVHGIFQARVLEWGVIAFSEKNGADEPNFQGKKLFWNRQIPSIYSEKAMAPHSSTLVWKIPWMEEPGRLQPMGSHRVGHD